MIFSDLRACADRSIRSKSDTRSFLIHRMRALHQGTLDRLRQITGIARMASRRRPNQQDDKPRSHLDRAPRRCVSLFLMRCPVEIEPNEEQIKEHREFPDAGDRLQSTRGREGGKDLPASMPATPHPTRGFSQTRLLTDEQFDSWVPVDEMTHRVPSR
jgi:hypothetical protein